MIAWRPALDFVVPGQPVPKARPRFARTKGGGVRTYTSNQTTAFETKIALFASSIRWKGYLAPSGVPVRLDILAIFERPKRLNRKRDPEGLVPHAVRPDIDNVAKAVLDGLSKAPARIFIDDGQVQVLRIEAFYAEKGKGPRTEVKLFVPTEE